ncbi:NETI motif-containing protein [Robertmurraya siralis]|uniref:NETI motif-containing protein n=1 Tax=Robertmurraya siralis TaxID=77777 RepID=A0A919WL44_9BACI|nr:NETI motif-containing protein [Robertmurraya siralis]GIN63728.1 NETI motif-containing protein [Robertmurraya siralis]
MSRLKQRFEVQENETIDQCLDRIQKAGYIPIKREEKPVFQEKKQGTTVSYEPIGRQIIFEAKKLKD